MTTETISYTSLRQNLSSVLNSIEDNKEIYLVKRKNHSDAVIIDRNDYESLLETLHLLSTSANSNRLIESLQQDENKEYEEVDL